MGFALVSLSIGTDRMGRFTFNFERLAKLDAEKKTLLRHKSVNPFSGAIDGLSAKFHPGVEAASLGIICRTWV